ncbi:hypothetical protein J3459_010020 [Metarhizium acridum]|nr:hypothetical protein J3459_010020 [Metarhizium acridum]
MIMAAAADMDNTLDQTTLATINLLESRLLRLEHLLHGPAASLPHVYQDSAAQKLKDMERRFSMVVSHFRVYSELLKICQCCTETARYHVIHSTDIKPRQVQSGPFPRPGRLCTAIPAVKRTQFNLSYYLRRLPIPQLYLPYTAIQDSPIPDPSESASLIALTNKMRAIEATQIAQLAEIAELRRRARTVIRLGTRTGVLNNSQSLADVETRVERIEKQIRQRERALEDAKQI